MAKAPTPSKGQAERARRIREEIERLRTGQGKPRSSGAGKSLKEQINERAAERKSGPKS